MSVPQTVSGSQAGLTFLGRTECREGQFVFSSKKSLCHLQEGASASGFSKRGKTIYGIENVVSKLNFKGNLVGGAKIHLLMKERKVTG